MLDSSAALNWAFLDEVTPESNALFLRAATEPVYVPTIWPYEVSHNLQRAFRSERLNEREVQSALQTYTLLDLTVVPDPKTPDLRALVQGMRAHQLSAYDLSFLTLAHRLGLPLATRDRQLAIAASALGIELL